MKRTNLSKSQENAASELLGGKNVGVPLVGVTFTVEGNQENPRGNPIPYLRTTQRGLWSPAAKRYAAWKQYVMAAYLKVDPALQTERIVLGDREVSVDIAIEWANKSHGDGDNVLKGILDALFADDKNVVEGSFSSKLSENKCGQVRVLITPPNW